MTVPPINLTQLRESIRRFLSVDHATSGDLKFAVAVPTLLALINTAESARAPDWEFVQAVLRDRGRHVTQDDHDAIDRLRESLARYTSRPTGQPQ